MSEARTAPEPAPAEVAAVLRDAPFVRLVARDDGDAIAAAGLLARAVRAADVPFQVRVDPDPVPEAADDAVPVTVGSHVGDTALPGSERPASTTAFAVARELGVEPDPVLALAGVVAAGSIPGADGSGDALAAARDRGRVRRRPGVGLPTTDAADLAASTLFRAPLSGDPAAARDVVADLGLPEDLGEWGEEAHRRLASRVAIEVADADGAVPRAAGAAERALRPFATDGPFATVAGYADALSALALEAPGTGVGLALADDPASDLRAAAVEAWRRHGLAAQRVLSDATTGRYDGAFVVRVDAPPSALPTVARLVRDFRSPEPVAIALTEGDGTDAAGPADGASAAAEDAPAEGATRAAAAATEPCDLGGVLATAAAEFGGTGHGTGTRATARVDGDGTDFAAAVREAL